MSFATFQSPCAIGTRQRNNGKVAVSNFHARVYSRRRASHVIVSMAQDQQNISRRHALAVTSSVLASLLFGQQAYAATSMPELPENSQAMIRKRVIPQGRPEPSSEDNPIKFVEDKEIKKLDAFEYQDIVEGSGDKQASRSSLAVVKYEIKMQDGMLVDSATKPIMFRVATNQVVPGLDKGVIGMKVGGVRYLRGAAGDILNDIQSGERALVKSSETIYAAIKLVNLDPY
mmetsp:Transcript_9039/g.15807  ORF Transcript_9039/g.15807 Transcript_9039/m.15807 type:complete len:230 (-) Transcript_9039:39-728(-)